MDLYFARRPHRVLPAVLVAASLVPGPAVKAEPVLDRALAGLRLIESKSCVRVKIDFNFRIRYSSHFPAAMGAELRISLHAIDPTQATALSLLKREALRPPDRNSGAIKAIDFVANEAGGPVLRILFDYPVSYQVAPGGDFESIVIAIAGKSPSPACKPIFPQGGGDGQIGTASPAPSAIVPARVLPSHSPPAGVATQAQSRQAAGMMDEARAATKKGDFAAAAKILSQVLALPENASSADAQELLGVVRQKSGQLPQARAEYEEFLRRYPDGEPAERVRQRLAGIATAEGGSSTHLRDPKAQQRGGANSEGTTWAVSGSASEFFIRDDSLHSLRDPSLPPDLNAAKDDHQVHLNTVLSSFDLNAAWSNSAMKSKFRFAGTEEHNFGNADKDIAAVAALSYEVNFRELDLTTRIGRQTRNTGGVLGRFDGDVTSWQASPFMRFNTVVGSPVERRKDAPFKNEKLFYGASVDFNRFWGGVETSLFAIEQRDRGWLDRRAIGAEVRYLQPDRSLFGTVDYDVHFNMLNAAILTGSYTFTDKSTISGSSEYRKAPYLSAWTALQSQPFLTLYDMLKLKTKEEIDQLAIDRTASYMSSTFSYTRPLNEKLQLSVDATIANASGTIASGGVDATLPPGTDYYGSAQLIGSNIFAEGDLYIAGLRYAKRPDSTLYVLDLSTRQSINAELKASPRLRLGYRDGIGTDLKEITIQPSLLLNYYWTRDFSLELEVGTKWTRADQLGVRETTTDLFFTAGFRYDFNADGSSTCVKPAPGCR